MGAPVTPSGLMQKYEAARLSFNLIFQKTLIDEQTDWQKFAEEVSSDTREQAYPFLDRLPSIREWVGARVINSASVRMQSLVNKEWEDTVGIPRVDFEDDRIGVYGNIIRSLAAQGAHIGDILLSDAMINGHSAYCYDGQYFYDTDHPVNMDDPSVKTPAGSSTQANYATSTPLNGDNLKSAIQSMTGLVGADGKPLRVRPTTLLVPSALEMTAKELCENKYIFKDLALTGGTHGATFTENILMGRLKVEVWPYLDAEPTAWQLLDNDGPVKPFLYQVRVPVEMTALTSPSDHNVFNFGEFLWGLRARSVAGYGQWWLASKYVG